MAGEGVGYQGGVDVVVDAGKIIAIADSNDDVGKRALFVLVMSRVDCVVADVVLVILESTCMASAVVL